MTWAEVAVAGQRVLESAGWLPEDAGRDAVLLARHVLGWDAGQWLTESRQDADAASVARFQSLIARRVQHEPIAYLTGEREFYGRVFTVTRDVLIPRPETELIVEEALKCLSDASEKSERAPASEPARTERGGAAPPLGARRGVRWGEAPRQIIDLGTGSGCLAITIALESPSTRVIATDISGAALTVARENARRLGVDGRIEFTLGAFLAGRGGPVDLILANPPYVADGDRASLPIDVRDFEPPVALFAGPDGLDVIRALLPLAAAALAPGGWLVMEIGQGQITHVQDLIAGMEGLAFHHVRADLQGIPRVVVVRAHLSAFIPSAA